MALKIVYKICCGIDVHRTFVVACTASTNHKGVTAYESHRFSIYTSGLKDLLQWLLQHNCKDVCMESIGKYRIPVYNVLENDCTIVLAHPKYVKAQYSIFNATTERWLICCVFKVMDTLYFSFSIFIPRFRGRTGTVTK